MAAAIAAFVGAAVNSRIIQRSMLYSIFAPLGGAVLTLGFLSGALVPNGGSVSWRDTKYSDAVTMYEDLKMVGLGYFCHVLLLSISHTIPSYFISSELMISRPNL